MSERQPPVLSKGPLTGAWFVMLKYDVLEDGSFVAHDKLEVHPETAVELDRLVACFEHSLQRGICPYDGAELLHSIDDSSLLCPECDRQLKKPLDEGAMTDVD